MRYMFTCYALYLTDLMEMILNGNLTSILFDFENSENNM